MSPPVISQAVERDCKWTWTRSNSSLLTQLPGWECLEEHTNLNPQCSVSGFLMLRAFAAREAASHCDLLIATCCCFFFFYSICPSSGTDGVNERVNADQLSHTDGTCPKHNTTNLCMRRWIYQQGSLSTRADCTWSPWRRLQWRSGNCSGKRKRRPEPLSSQVVSFLEAVLVAASLLRLLGVVSISLAYVNHMMALNSLLHKAHIFRSGQRAKKWMQHSILPSW